MISSLLGESRRAARSRFLQAAFLLPCLTLPKHALRETAMPSSKTEPAAQPDRLARAAAQAGGSAAQQMLRELAGLGPRLTGSAGEHRATEWAMDQMRRIGLSRVHAEPWILERGWTRGHAMARLVAASQAAGQRSIGVGPGRRPLDVCALGWTGSTPGRVQGALLAVDATASPDNTAWRGKVLLVRGAADPVTSFFALPGLARRAEAAGALAVLVADNRPGPAHAGPLSFPAETSSLPVLNLAQRDAAMLGDLLAKERSPGAAALRLELDVKNTFTPGLIVAHNVVGEIPAAPPSAQTGSDAVETILLGAHLDSWDLSEGATDDAYGVAAILGAAQTILASGVQPRRAIRIVLFTGEEQGLLGSRAYIGSHEGELDSLLCALVMDWGSGPITQLPVAGHHELKEPLQRILSQITPRVSVASGYLTYTDAFSFTGAGIAGLALLQDSPSYERIGHSAQDRLENADLATLAANVGILTALSLGLADAPERPARRWTPQQRETELLRVHAPAGLLEPAMRERR